MDPLNNQVPVQDAESSPEQPNQTGRHLNSKLIIIVAVVLLLFGGSAYAWFFTDLNDKLPFLKVTEPENISNNNTNINDTSSSTEALLIDYKQKEEWPGLIMCYLYQHPEASQYFPEATKLGSFSPSSSTESDEAMLDVCSVYNQEAYDFILGMLKTDVDQDGLNLFMEESLHTSDNNTDTDGDTYSDLTELINGYDPNDLWTEEQEAKTDKLSLMTDQPSFDITEAVTICKTMGGRDEIDACLEQLSRHSSISDPNYCDTVGFSDESIYKDWCYNNVLAHSGNPEDCLKITSSMKYYCLAPYVEKEKSLRPCMLLSDSELPICINPNFTYLDEKSDCDEYKDKMSVDDYGDCLWFIALNTKNPIICEYKNPAEVFTCVNNLAYELKDPSICEYYDIYSTAFKTECINNTPDGRNLDTESGYLYYCQSYSEDSSRGRSDKSNCFAELAKIYDKSEYCIEAANLTKIDNAHLYQGSLEDCYSGLIENNNRIDLCPLIQTERILENQLQDICN